MSYPRLEKVYLANLKVAMHCLGYMGPVRCLGEETIRSLIVTNARIQFKVDFS